MIDPFANDSESMQIGELIIENQQEKVIIYGDIDIYCNAQGLQHAQQLHELTGNILQALQAKLAENPDERSSINNAAATDGNNEQLSVTDNPFL